MSVPPLRIIGVINVVLASAGFFALLWNVVGFYALPASFIDTYGPFMRRGFVSMCIASSILLPILGYTGIQLLRSKCHAIILCEFLFVSEIIYFSVLMVTWQLPWALTSLVSPVIVGPGLVNLGLALQIASGYPIWGLILLLKHPRTLVHVDVKDR